jgi:4a-hydroxytetrahydrobiopterin dehydratase
MTSLADRELIPPRGSDSSPLDEEHLRALHNQLGNDWMIVNSRYLEKEFQFPDFKSALAFANRVGELADSVDHHPEICLSWGKTKISIWTHSVGGLSEADFIFAAKSSDLAKSENPG